MKKAIFIDVDGTLTNAHEQIPSSAIYAIQKARSIGHQIFLCTGRSKPELYDFIVNIGFDGYICAGGGYVEINQKVLYHKKFEEKDLHSIIDFFNEHEIDFYVESNHGLFASKNCKKHLLDILYEETQDREKALSHPFYNVLIDQADLYQLQDVNKICFLGSTTPIEQVEEAFSDRFTIMHCTVEMFGKNSGEVVIKDMNKAFAIHSLLEAIHMDQKDTFAFGDGKNDIEMLEYVHTGIAMGNAHEALKAIADDVCASVDDEGLYQSFVKYHLLEE